MTMQLLTIFGVSLTPLAAATSLDLSDPRSCRRIGLVRLPIALWFAAFVWFA